MLKRRTLSPPHLLKLLRRGEEVTQLKALFTQLQAGREQLHAKLQRSYDELACFQDREREADGRYRAQERLVIVKQGESLN